MHPHRSSAALATPLSSGRSPRTVLSGVVAPALRIGDTPSSLVFAAVRHLGPVARDAIAANSGLSIATVNRQVTALLESNLLRERPDLTTPGAIGRPRIPVEVNHEPYLTLGLHIGARVTSIVASDLFGRTLDAVETQTPTGSQARALESLADSARRYLSRWRRRRPLWVGVAVGGVVDSPAGLVDHPRLGWAQAPVGPVLGRALGLPISVASHVDAMAGAELLLATTFGGGPAPRVPRGQQPLRLRPRDGRLRAGDRRPGAYPDKWPGHDRRLASGSGWPCPPRPPGCSDRPARPRACHRPDVAPQWQTQPARAGGDDASRSAPRSRLRGSARA